MKSIIAAEINDYLLSFKKTYYRMPLYSKLS